ncbi:MAG: ABC transporter permease [Myxococcota bacterium]
MILDVLAEGWRGVAAHRVRSLLSGLGILFGVAAIITILGIGEGARREQERLIGQLGVLNFMIRARDFGDDAAARDEARRVSQGLGERDVAALREVLPHAVRVGGMAAVPVADMVPRLPEGQRLRGVGAELDYLAALNLVRREGRGFDARDVETAAPVCLLGLTARNLLFPGKPAVGEHVRIAGVWLTVVGVFEEPGGGGGAVEGVSVEDRDRDVVVPWSTARARFGNPLEPAPMDEILVQVGDVAHVVGDADLAGRVVKRLHRDAADTEMVVPLKLLEQSQAQQRIFNLVMGMIAGISLLVGGIGIMNIMLASVMERTKEVGIRLAVGARPRDIQALFLAESALISLVGGGLGIFAGLLLSAGVAAATGWSVATSPWAVLLAAALSMGEGVVFGWLPARSAARLSPAVAVRAAN